MTLVNTGCVSVISFEGFMGVHIEYPEKGPCRSLERPTAATWTTSSRGRRSECCNSSFFQSLCDKIVKGITRVFICELESPLDSCVKDCWDGGPGS